MPTKLQTDTLPEMLERVKAGGPPETPYEMLFHKDNQKTFDAITRKIAKKNDTILTPATFLAALQGKGDFVGDRGVALKNIAELIPEVIKRVQKLTLRNYRDEMLSNKTHHLVKDKISKYITIWSQAWSHGQTPMSVENMTLFEERTRAGKYEAIRTNIAQHGYKNDYALDYIVYPESDMRIEDQKNTNKSLLHAKIPNTVWANLLLAAIELDDYGALPRLMEYHVDDEKNTGKKENIEQILACIIEKPIISVSPQMLVALMGIYYPDPINMCYPEAIKLENIDLIEQIFIDDVLIKIYKPHIVDIAVGFFLQNNCILAPICFKFASHMTDQEFETTMTEIVENISGTISEVSLDSEMNRALTRMNHIDGGIRSGFAEKTKILRNILGYTTVD